MTSAKHRNVRPIQAGPAPFLAHPQRLSRQRHECHAGYDTQQHPCTEARPERQHAQKAEERQGIRWVKEWLAELLRYGIRIDPLEDHPAGLPEDPEVDAGHPPFRKQDDLAQHEQYDTSSTNSQCELSRRPPSEHDGDREQEERQLDGKDQELYIECMFIHLYIPISRDLIDTLDLSVARPSLAGPVRRCTRTGSCSRTGRCARSCRSKRRSSGSR